jgi:maleylacetoacetate isomerase
VHLLKEGGQQLAPAFRSLNPEALVPVLEDDRAVLTQSLAIIEYLEETHPSPPLLPPDPRDRAYVRSIALAIACEIHPLNNLRVLRYLVRTLGATEAQKNAWYRHWVEQGLATIETRLAAEKRSGRFVLGHAVTIADVVLVPQVFNAQRFDCRLDHVPTVMRIADACMELPAFIDAQPSRQPDTE